MDNFLTQIQDIALSVRAWTENEAIKREDSYDVDDGLNGFCAIASGELHKRLKKANISSEIHMAMGDLGCHVFVMVGDYIVDVTATQFEEFKFEPVLIKHSKELDDMWAFTSDKKFDSAAALRKHQMATGWPRSQICYG